MPTTPPQPPAPPVVGGEESFTSTATTYDQAGNIVSQVVTTTVYRTPDKLLLSETKDTYNAQPGSAVEIGGTFFFVGAGLKRTKSDIKTCDWEPSIYGPKGAINQPLQKGEATRTYSWVAGEGGTEEWTMTAQTVTSKSYDERRMLVVESTAKWGGGATAGKLEPKELMIKTFRDQGPQQVTVTTDRYGWDPGEKVWAIRSSDTAPGAGTRPGGIVSGGASDDVVGGSGPFQFAVPVAAPSTSIIQPGNVTIPPGSTFQPSTNTGPNGGTIGIVTPPGGPPITGAGTVTDPNGKAVSTAHCTVLRDGSTLTTTTGQTVAIPSGSTFCPSTLGTVVGPTGSPVGTGVLDPPLVVSGSTTSIVSPTQYASVDFIVDPDPSAPSLSLSDGNLDQATLDLIASQLQELSGLWQHEYTFTGVNIPWLRRGSVVQFTDLHDEEGNVVTLPPVLVHSLQLVYDESSDRPSVTRQVKALAWTQP